MARRDFRRGAVAIRKTRLTTWFSIGFTQTTITTQTSVLVAALNAAGLALRPFTIVRTHLEVMLRSDQSAAIEVQQAALGMAVVSDQSVGIGVTAVPTPVTDLASSMWFQHRVLFAHHQEITDRSEPAVNYSIDSKAMRKVELGQDVILVLENAAATGIVVNIAGRFLVKNN